MHEKLYYIIANRETNPEIDLISRSQESLFASITAEKSKLLNVYRYSYTPDFLIISFMYFVRGEIIS